MDGSDKDRTFSSTPKEVGTTHGDVNASCDLVVRGALDVEIEAVLHRTLPVRERRDGCGPRLQYVHAVRSLLRHARHALVLVAPHDKVDKVWYFVNRERIFCLS